MTAKHDFDQSIQAADDLLRIYAELRHKRGLGARGRLNAANQDLLWLPRSAVVAAISALDAYVHSVLQDQLATALQASPVPPALAKALSQVVPIVDGPSMASALPIILAHDAGQQITQKYMDDKVAFHSYQTPGKIVAAYTLLGYVDVFQEVAAMWPGPQRTAPNIKRNLQNYAKRRNQIAHEGDRDVRGLARPMTPNYARQCHNFVDNLVGKLNRVVYGI